MKLVPAPLALVIALLASSPRAQEASDPWSLIPEDALFVAWCDGPAKLRESFQETRLLRALTGPEVSGYLAPHLESWRSTLDDALAGSGFDCAAAEQMLSDYRGRVLFAFGFDMKALGRRLTEGIDIVGDDFDCAEVGFWFVFVVTDDGKTDLESLARVAEESAAKGEESEQLFDVHAGSRTLRAVRASVSTAVPFMVGPHLVTVGAGDLEATLERLLAHERTRTAGDMAHLTGSAGVWLNARSALEMFSDQLPADEEGAMVGAILDASGVRALDTVSCSVAPAGAHVVGTFGAELRDDARGLLAALATRSDRGPSLDLIPAQRRKWWSVRFDPAACYAAIGSLIDAGAKRSGQSFAQTEDQVADYLHVRLREDLIAHLGDELFAVSQGVDPDAEDLEESEGACLGALLDDPKAVRESLEKIVRSRGLHVSRKTEDYRGFDVHRFSLGGTSFYYAVSGRALLVAFGEPGLRDLHAVLDEEKDRAEGKPRAPLPKAIEERLEQVARGWMGISVEAMSDSLDAARTALYTVPFAFEQDFGDEDDQATTTNTFADLDVFDEALDLSLDLLERYDLETCVSVFRAERRRFQVQMIW